jgi:rod shape determining protein RodA
LLIFLDPQIDPLGAGYNVIQSKIAVGSGRFIGKGFLHGSQSQLDFLPANHTDFAFSTFAEQFGFIGGVIVLALFAFMLIRMLTWTKTAKDRQGAYIIVGAVALILAHVMINVGMTIGIMPVTGLPLPFISYGGTSYLTFMIAIGLAMSVHQRRYTY